MRLLAKPASFLVALILPSVSIVACSGVDSSPPSSSSSSRLAGDDHPDPIVSIDLTNGSTLEYYEIFGRAIVSEFGSAEHAPLLAQYESYVKTSRLVDLFTVLRPDLPVPAALVDLQSRHPAIASAEDPSDIAVDAVTLSKGSARSDPSGATGSAGGTSSIPKAPKDDGGSFSAESSRTASGGGKPGIEPLACSNNCCNGTWTQNTLCNPNINGAAYQWFLFDYGYSYANGWYSRFWAAVCAESGTSTWTLSSTDGLGGTWSVPAGYYRWESDSPTCSGGGFCTGPTLTSSVNSKQNQEGHDYCGGLFGNQ